MEKNQKIIIIVILAVIAVALTTTFVISTIFYNDWGFGDWGSKQVREKYIRKTETFDIRDIKNMDLHFSWSDAKVIFTETKEGKIIQYSKRELKEKHLFSVEKHGDTLDIEQGDNPFLFGFLSFGFGRPYYEIHIPKEYKESLTLKLTSNSIVIDEEITLKDVKLETVSGSIKIDKLKAENVILKSVSGSIKVESLIALESDVKTTSGSIKIGDLEGESTLKSISGSVRVQNNRGSSEITTTSGSIRVEKFYMEEDTSIKSVSGSIYVGLDTSTSCIISTKSTSGSIRIPGDEIGDNPENKLKLNTTSGSIRVEVIS